MRLQDIFLTPIYLLFIYGFLMIIRSKVTDRETRRFFLPAFTLKVFGALGVGLIYYYYYGSGDTTLFYDDTYWVYNPIAQEGSLSKSLSIIFSKNEHTPETYYYTSKIYYFRDTPTFVIVRISGFLSLFTFNTYSLNAIFFACFSFAGSWSMYKVFIRIYPQMVKQLAVAIFFFPSVFFWGSGLLKDSITFGALGFTMYGFYFAIIRRESIIKNGLILLGAIYTIYSIKIFILYCFLPSLMLWAYLEFNSQIRSEALRVLIAPILLLVIGVAGYVAVVKMTADTDYSVDQLTKKTQVTANYLRHISKEGSYYEIGQFDGSLSSIVTNLPKAITVSLFRPFLWEARNPVSLLSALEAAYFLFLTVNIFRKIKLKTVFYTLRTQPVVSASLLFALTFSFAIGMATSNFGSLVRYKIPMMPFYVAALMIILEMNKKQKKKKVRMASQSFGRR